MRERLFDHVNLDPRRTHLPDGLVREAELERHCEDYERAICAAGSIDLLLLGIGRNGHIGFNEPGSELWTRTRRVELHAWTRADAAEEFGGVDHVRRTPSRWASPRSSRRARSACWPSARASPRWWRARSPARWGRAGPRAGYAPTPTLASSPTAKRRG
jgi:hypothetical protein